MPTQSDFSPHLSSISSTDVIPTTRTTCPPETERLATWFDASQVQFTPDDNTHPSVESPSSLDNAASADGDGDLQQTTDTPGLSPTSSSSHPSSSSETSNTDDDEREILPLTPATCPSTVTDDHDIPLPKPISDAQMPEIDEISLSYQFSNVRLVPEHSSSFLRAGSKFVGTQNSDRRAYNVEVEIKHVDMCESYLCGYLKIQGLTDDHPTLTTCFEGEIIGTKYTFSTRHHSWGATDETDMNHWQRLPAYRPLAKLAKRPDFNYRDFAKQENIFMRWKERFLLPDHRVRGISGASFEGFYYICFNQVDGTVEGIYFHAKSEKYGIPKVSSFKSYRAVSNSSSGI
ncbi:hypothetical protein FQN57_003793 [Myotisia sp. PD_48]|nr:hypothetical protein FQN57_003793 [Myotisia sp. PD_48]